MHHAHQRVGPRPDHGRRRLRQPLDAAPVRRVDPA